jgi:hypothetical protein
MMKMKLDISSRWPIHIEVDASAFGEIFAGMGADDQVQVFRSMVEHMRPHRMQWDYIAIELDKPENREVREELMETLRWTADEVKP